MRTSRAFIILSISTTAAFAAGLLQERRLSSLRQTLSSLRQNAANPELNGYSVDPRPVRPPWLKPQTGPALNLPELQRLLKSQTTRDPAADDLDQDAREARTQEADRLADLFAKVDEATAEQLFQSLADQPSSLTLAESLFSDMNPGQALLYHLARESGVDRTKKLAADLKKWAFIAPEEALQWFRECAAKGDPAVASTPVREAILPCESRLDPKQAVLDTIQLLRDDHNNFLISSISFVEALRGNEERRAFLAALAEVSQDSDKTETVAAIRAAFVPTLALMLSQEPFADSVKILNEDFTEEERRDFCRTNARSGREDDKWGPWFAALPLPVDDGHPVVILAIEASRQSKEPVWLLSLPQNELRDKAIVRYLQGQSDIVIASKWVPELQEGPVRSAMEEDIRKGWKNRGWRKASTSW